MDNLRIDADRLWDSLMDLAQIGATDKGGVCRLALTDLDKQGRDLFTRWCEEAGCTVTVDGVGNIFARRPGLNDDLPPVMTGSHLDSQPTGGKFDGAYGVLAGLEVIRALNDAELETDAAVEVVAWTNEEGSRFSPPMMGSGAFAQVFEENYVLERPDNVTGETVGEELKRIGYNGPQQVGGRDVGAYFEAHIEQGPILEDSEKTVGIVTGAQGQRWYEVFVTGQEAHAGPTPMTLRKDALVASARMIDAVNKIGHDHLPGACATCGFIEVKPNSRNTIPGDVFFTVDLRHPSDEILAEMDQAFRERCQTIASDSIVDLRIEDFWHFPATPFDDACVEAVRHGAMRGGYTSMEIVSGAGHDAVYMARVAPTGMIFIPCEGGISHNEIENATREDCAAGAQVLLSAIVARANTQVG
jgi:N-carbamoyl-L-amino-acid hydrolase